MKPRILFNSEASYLATGYAVYCKEVISRLHNAGYEIAEFASFAEPNDPRNRTPWPFFPVKQVGDASFGSDPHHVFGKGRFEEICCKYKPHAVLCLRDAWMDEHVFRSPLRPYYKLLAMPTLDGKPLHPQWLADYVTADGIFGYSQWGLDTLREQAPQTKIISAASPAVEYDLFKMVPDKSGYKKSFGISPDSLIIGTVMRNQERKLFPDLIEAFAEFLKQAPPELASKSYLYLHTCWPDLGFDICELVRDNDVRNKVIMTYYCMNCQTVFPRQFVYAVTNCPKCSNLSARLPMSHAGVSREALASVMKLFDAYVQLASCSGFEMPVAEAAACGTQTFTLDYAAMEDFPKTLNSIPIKAERLYKEVQTGRMRALPDNGDLIKKLIEFLSKPKEVRASAGFKTASLARKNYNWDVTAKKWADAIDALDYSTNIPWDSPPRPHIPNMNIPPALCDSDFIQWGLIHIAGRPDLVYSYLEASLVRDLTWQATVSNVGGLGFNDMSLLGDMPKIRKFDRDAAVRLFLDMCNERNKWEQRRAN